MLSMPSGSTVLCFLLSMKGRNRWTVLLNAILVRFAILLILITTSLFQCTIVRPLADTLHNTCTSRSSLWLNNNKILHMNNPDRHMSHTLEHPSLVYRQYYSPSQMEKVHTIPCSSQILRSSHSGIPISTTPDYSIPCCSPPEQKKKSNKNVICNK